MQANKTSVLYFRPFAVHWKSAIWGCTLSYVVTGGILLSLYHYGCTDAAQIGFRYRGQNSNTPIHILELIHSAGLGLCARELGARVGRVVLLRSGWLERWR